MMIPSEFSDLYAAEDLHADLVPYLSEVEGLGLVLRHPLVYSVPHFPVLNRTMNAVLAQKRQALDAAREARNWSTYVILHERPYRIDALHDIAEQMSLKEYWRTVAFIWVDCENVHQKYDEWLDIWCHIHAQSHMTMSKSEKKTLAAMPDELTLFRGVGHEDAIAGLSWTVDRNQAIWFARRFASLRSVTPLLVTGKAAKSDVLAYFSGRGEREIVIAPFNVVVQSVTRPARNGGRLRE